MSNPHFQRWLDQFFTSYYTQRPVNATFIGEHAHDRNLPDWSADGLARLAAEMATLQRDLATIDVDALSPAEALDYRLAAGFLEIQQWELASQHFQRGNPSLYVGEAIFGIIGLFLTDHAPLDARIAAAIARLHQVPALLQAGMQNITAAPAAWAQKALQECVGVRAMLGEGIDLFLAQHGVENADLRAAADGALLAVEAFAHWLEGQVAAANADVACGAEAFALLMRAGHCLTQTPDEIATYALQQMELAQQELVAGARAQGADDWRAALAELATLHPAQDEYYAAYAQTWQACRDLSDAKDLVTWHDFPIAYMPQPVWARSAAPHLYFLFYRAPAAVNRPPVHHYLVTPIEPEMAAEEQQRRLQATNDSVIKLNHVVHHGAIGHHVQNWYAYRAHSRIGRMAAVDTASRIAMFCGGTMAEGWACYATTLMQEAGFLTALEELGEVHGRVRMAARAVVDVRLHQRQMTLDEAAAFYQQHTAMSTAAARAEAIKNSMFPGAAMIYLIGHDEIMALRNEMQALQGANFNLRAFHNEFLSYGSIPVTLIAQAMRERLRQTV